MYLGKYESIFEIVLGFESGTNMELIPEKKLEVENLVTLSL